MKLRRWEHERTLKLIVLVEIPSKVFTLMLSEEKVQMEYSEEKGQI